MAPKRKKIKKLPPVKINDPFVKAHKKPDYKNVEDLTVYLSDKGKIMSKSRTGLTAKTQRQLTLAVKRARHLALLPFINMAE